MPGSCDLQADYTPWVCFAHLQKRARPARLANGACYAGATHGVLKGMRSYRLAVEIRERSESAALRAVQAAEREGCEAAWYTSPPSHPDALRLADAAARATQRIQLVPGVFNPRTHSPSALQERLRDLEASAPGRLQLAVGRGEPRLGPHPRRDAPPFSAFLETLRDGLPSRVQLAVAAVGPNTLRLAGRLADTVVLNLGAAPEYVQWAVMQIAHGARDARRPLPQTACWFCVRDDEARARRDLAYVLTAPRQGEVLVGAAGLDSAPLHTMRAAYAADGLAGAAALLPDHWMDLLALPGERDQRQARLEEYRLAGMQIAIVPLRCAAA